MTTHASQGQSLSPNAVNLNQCTSHQAFYTALSRSTTADSTIIINLFSSKHITGNASSALRREFQELEMLDDITKLWYDSALPASVVGQLHKELNVITGQTRACDETIVFMINSTSRLPIRCEVGNL